MMTLPALHPAQVAVFSGNGKAKLINDDFASDDTEIKTDQPKAGGAQKQGSRGALTWLAAMILGNMFLIWASGVFGWDVMAHAWPMELVLMGVLFFALMVESTNIWMIIPGGMIMGNGWLLGYYALTGRWQDWSLLWPLEPLLIAISIIAPFWVMKRKDGGAATTRQLGKAVLVLAALTFVVSLAVAIMQSL
jgi:hypothetical protein